MTRSSGRTAVRVPKASELVAASLRRQIVTGDIEPGGQLPSETALMEAFGVSRPTMREAFRILESESLITVLRGAHGGARALAPDLSIAARHLGLLLQFQGVPLTDVYRTRASIETSAVTVLAGLPPEALAPLEELVDRARSLLDAPEEFAANDTRIHQEIVDLAGLRTMSVLAGMLLNIMQAHNKLFMAVHAADQERKANELALRAYRRLLAKLRDADPQGAAAVWAKHLKSVEQVMVGDSDTTLVELLS